MGAAAAGSPVMIDLVRAEVLKIRTVRSTVVMGLIVVGLSLLPAVLVCLLVNKFDLIDMDPHERVSVTLLGMQFSQILLAVIASLVITGEYRFGTIRTTFLTEPRRLRVLAAKWLTVMALAALVAAVMVGLTVGVCSLILHARGIDYSLTTGQIPRLVYGTVLYTVLYAVTALAIGTVLRNSAASIVIVIVIPVIVESIIAAILSALHHGSWGRWLPFGAGGQITADTTGESVLGERFSPWVGYGYGWLWALALGALGAWLLQRRDA
jgi:ABC-2 type transport system permease protein